jgi:hypothetical protein
MSRNIDEFYMSFEKNKKLRVKKWKEGFLNKKHKHKLKLK